MEASVSFRPQMMISWPIGLSSSVSNRASERAFAVSLTGPMPSPPPISRTAGNCRSISSSILKSSYNHKQECLNSRSRMWLEFSMRRKLYCYPPWRKLLERKKVEWASQKRGFETLGDHQAKPSLPPPPRGSTVCSRMDETLTRQRPPVRGFRAQVLNTSKMKPRFLPCTMASVEVCDDCSKDHFLV